MILLEGILSKEKSLATIENDFKIKTKALYPFRFHSRSKRTTKEFFAAFRSLENVIRGIGVRFFCDFRGCGLRWDFNWF